MIQKNHYKSSGSVWINSIGLIIKIYNFTFVSFVKICNYFDLLINGFDFIVDWANTNQKKWYPYFFASSGFGFSDTRYDYDYSCSGVGSRLCFESQEKAKYAGITFTDLYEIYLVKDNVSKEVNIGETTNKVVKNFDYKTIKTFTDACKKLGISDKEPECLELLPEFRKSTIAVYKLFIIHKAINNGWIPNWSNNSEYKYYPWKELASSGFGFSDAAYGYYCTYSIVGSRLCTDSSDKALYIGKQFEDLYIDWFCFEK
jgi:hypothetical protein